MKIAFLEPHLQIYGGIRRILELSNRLVDRGHEVTIYHSDGTPCTWMENRAETKPATDILQGQHDVLIYNDPTTRDLDLARRAAAKLKVFYCLALYNKELMLPGLRGLSLKKVLWRRGVTLRTILMKEAILKNDLLLANASWIKIWLQENLGVESILLLGGVNTEIFYPVAVAKDPNVIRIIYSGDPRRSKGTPIIEAARKIVEAKLPNVVFETYSGKGIPQSEMAQMYSSADIFVDAQSAGGWNNPVAEAMACQVPVVCTDIGAVQDFAFHEQTALLVPAQDSEAIAAAILRLAGDPALRQKLRENGYQQIRNFSWDESAENLERLLEEGLNQRDLNRSYIRVRSDVAKLVPVTAKRILDVGCSIGTLGSYLRERNKAEIIGLELDPKMAAIAATKLDRVIQGNVEEFVWEDNFVPGQFDCIIFADLLEHLKDPWSVLKKANDYLAPDGTIVVSLPNITHISTVTRLLFKQDWPYNERGIHDRTHLRFFVLRTIREMFSRAGLVIQRVERNYRFADEARGYNRFAKYVAPLGLRSWLTHQYLVVAHKESSSRTVANQR